MGIGHETAKAEPETETSDFGLTSPDEMCKLRYETEMTDETFLGHET